MLDTPDSIIAVINLANIAIAAAHTVRDEANAEADGVFNRSVIYPNMLLDDINKKYLPVVEQIITDEQIGPSKNGELEAPDTIKLTDKGAVLCWEHRGPFNMHMLEVIPWEKIISTPAK